MASVLWLHGGACSGNTMSFLNADEPNVVDLIVDFGLDILWHPSLGMELGENAQKIFYDCVNGETSDIFVFEGTVIEGPDGTGRYNIFADRPMKEWVEELANAASIVVAIGDCACWGGIPATAPNPTDSTGLQFHKRDKGGFLGPDFESKAGLPVINIPGCPAHPDWITQILVALATGRAGRPHARRLPPAEDVLHDLHADRLHPEHASSPTRSRRSASASAKGCLFYDLGCRGPMTHTPCNRILWNRQVRRRPVPACRASAAPSPSSRSSILHPAPCSRRRRSWVSPEGHADGRRQGRVHQDDRRRQGHGPRMGRGRHVRRLSGPASRDTWSNHHQHRRDSRHFTCRPGRGRSGRPGDNRRRRRYRAWTTRACSAASRSS